MMLPQSLPPQPLPQPLLPNPLPPQQNKRIIINRQLFPPSLLQPFPHPQFVAAKSLILVPPKINLQCILCVTA